MTAYRVMRLAVLSALLTLCTTPAFAYGSGHNYGYSYGYNSYSSFDYCRNLRGDWVIPLYNINNRSIKRFVNVHVYQVKPILDAHGFYNLIGTANGETLVDSKCVQAEGHIMTVTLMTKGINLRSVEPVSLNTFEGFYRYEFVIPQLKRCALCALF